MYALSRRNDTNAQYWVKRNHGVAYFEIKIFLANLKLKSFLCYPLLTSTKKKLV